MESIRIQEFSLGIAGIVGHPVIDIYKMEIVALLFYFFFDQLIGIPDAIDYIPAGDAGFDGNKGQGDVAELLAGAADQLLKENKHFLRMAAVAEVVIAGINDDGIRVIGGQEAVEEPIACGEGRAAEPKIDGLIARKVFIQALPEPDGGTAVEKQFGIVGQCRSFLFQSLDLVFVPDHEGILCGKFTCKILITGQRAYLVQNFRYEEIVSRNSMRGLLAERCNGHGAGQCAVGVPRYRFAYSG